MMITMPEAKPAASESPGLGPTTGPCVSISDILGTSRQNHPKISRRTISWRRVGLPLQNQLKTVVLRWWSLGDSNP